MSTPSEEHSRRNGSTRPAHTALVALIREEVRNDELAGINRSLRNIERRIGRAINTVTRSGEEQVRSATVSELALDAIEVHAIKSRSLVDKKSSMPGIWVGYSEEYEPRIIIHLGSSVGLESHMRDITITVKIKELDIVALCTYRDARKEHDASGQPIDNQTLGKILEELLEASYRVSGKPLPHPRAHANA